MNTVNAMVKNGQFTAQLANTVFALCAQLKTSGQLLESTHKSRFRSPCLYYEDIFQTS